MSRTYDLCCEQCLVHVWIGQGRKDGSEFIIYSGDADMWPVVVQFFKDHLGHPLRLLDSEQISDDSKSLSFPDDD